MGILRFLLAIAVVIAHSTPIFGITLVGGEIAVKTFFIISGFYMALVLSEKYIGTNNSYSLFITNRLLKLYPIYWVILLLSILLSFVAFYQNGLAGSQKISSLVTAISNGTMTIPVFIWYCFSTVFIVFQDFFIFIGLNSDGTFSFVKDFHLSKEVMMRFMFLPQSWTIALEISFYLIVPFLNKWKSWKLACLFLFSITVRYWLRKQGFYSDPWSYRFFPSELMYFLVGIFSYRFYSNLKQSINKPFQIFSVILAIVVTICYQFYNSKTSYILYPYIIAFLIPGIFHYLKNNKLDSTIGELSYPIYMSHITIMIMIQKFKIPLIQSLGTTTALVSILFSLLLSKLITVQIESFRQSRVKVNLK
ncbi:MAG: acyltransferase [Leadbetterella sp.]|nr:acyltransferase [Leadbetterella sp.]